MLFQIKIINGQKTIVPLTADTGAGAPVGSLISMYKKSSPSGYLYCDGSTFDETAYPALYQYLGSNVLPDYREFALVGAEENTTDVYNASTNPTGTIHDHDVYTEGQAKDDQLQEHNHALFSDPNTSDKTGYSWFSADNGGNSAFKNTELFTDNPTTGRVGTVTRGKRKAVYFYIKATSGLTENQQENVLNTINENNSYSTEEHATGKKWIDGKDIYSITVDCGALPDATTKSVATGITNISNIISIKGIANTSDANTCVPIPYVSINPNDTSLNIACYYSVGNINLRTFIDMTVYTKTYITIEYTKTTD